MIRYINRLPKEGSDRHFRLRTEWNDDSALIFVIDESYAWKGEISSLEIYNLSQQFVLSSNDYTKEIKEVLTADGGDSNFTYCIEKDFFTWKKVDPDTHMKIKYGSVKLEGVSFQKTVEDMIDLILDKNKDLNKQVKDLEKKTEKLESEQNNLKEKCQILCVEKSSLEKSLYSAFASVLNTKKDKIEDLEEQLAKVSKKCEQQTESVTENSESKATVNKNTKQTSRKKATAATSKPKPSSRKEKSNNVLQVIDQPKPEVENNHYDSDTDIDEMDTDDENNSRFDFVPHSQNIISAKVDDPISDPFDEELPSTSDILPKRIRLENVCDRPGVSGKASGGSQNNSVAKTKSSSKNTPLKKSSLNSQPIQSQFDTQKLFDDF